MRSLVVTASLILFTLCVSFTPESQEFQGQAVYYSKSKMVLGSFGARMSEAQKKQIEARLKNRLEKTYTLNFNKEESLFTEDEKLDAISGATDSWGDNFSRGDQYKNVKNDELIQSQEFYGKRFLVKDKLQEIKWIMGKETKQIGQYTCFKATAVVPSRELAWYDFSWGDLRTAEQANNPDSKEGEEELKIELTNIEAWYTPQIPVSHGPGEYWGLPGLILEVSAGNTTMLCSKVVINPKETIEIEAPKRGQEISKKDYQETVMKKMKEMRDNRGRRRS